MFSIDFMFNESWHELCTCYEALGWEKLDRNVAAPAAGPLVTAEFQKNESEFGLLHYSMITDDGEAYDPPSTQSLVSLMERRLKKGTHRNVQVQLWATNEAKMSQKQKSDLHELYVALRKQLVISMYPNGVGE